MNRLVIFLAAIVAVPMMAQLNFPPGNPLMRPGGMLSPFGHPHPGPPFGVPHPIGLPPAGGSQWLFQNHGDTNVMACGFDGMGVWRVLPLTVSYQAMGAQYNVTVLNAWNPWTSQWDNGVDVQAYNTDFTLRGHTYDYYVVLSTGTFYFNL
jgi:hypothetical protein